MKGARHTSCLSEVFRLGARLGVLDAESLAREFRGNLRSNARLATPVKVAEDACRDPKDPYILGLCESTSAGFLVTGDKDLVESGWRGTMKIVTPHQFWEHCGQRC